VVSEARFLLGLVVSLLAVACGSTEPGPSSKGEDCDEERYYADFDHDGLGDPDDSKSACSRPEDYVDNADDDDPDCAGQHVFYEDQDGDELGDPRAPVEACTQPEGTVDNHDDEEPDCETNDSDECGVCAGPGPGTAYSDADDDGLGDPDVSIELCELPSGWVGNRRDSEPDCATNDTDDCGVCGGENASLDCAGVCGGEATLDACDRCTGGTTGVDPAVTDSDGDGFPDECDQCLEEGVRRLVVQWTEVDLFGAVFGGPYTFQALLFENGDFAFHYRTVEPFGNATVTVGHQGEAGLNAVELGYGSRYPTAYPRVYFRRGARDRVTLEYTVPLPWQDIRSTGTALVLEDDEVEPYTLPFAFPYAGQTHSQIGIAANGFIGLSEPYGDYDNGNLPDTRLGAMIAPFWDDLDPQLGGSVRYQILDGSCESDCNGDFGGVAQVDACGKCAGGNTSLVPNADRDCNGDCFGTAFRDTCGHCVGGETGRLPSDPGDCPTAPDLLVDGQYLRNTIEEDFVNVPTDSCLVAEACVTGVGRRRVVRFGTRIANIGNEDMVIGEPADGNPLWEYDPCHGHYHFEDYANYDLINVASGATLPIGTKNGFCVLDLEMWDPDIAVNGCGGRYDCGFQGISAGCADVYDAALQCQWIDITGIANGQYDLRVTTNPQQALSELDYDNNSATVRIEISDTDVVLVDP
jgi:hypothetical protein